jgi:hypothetical protein
VISDRMRRRRRLLDTYVRVELEEQGRPLDEPETRVQRSLLLRPESAEQIIGDGEESEEQTGS